MNPGERRTARPTDRLDEPPANHLAGQASVEQNADDSLRVTSSSTHRSRRRLTLRQIADQLSERDRAVLRSVADLRLVTARQLERLHFREGSPLTQARRARRCFERLHSLELLARLVRRVGGLHAGSAGFIYRLSVNGRRLLDLDGPEGGRRRRLPEPSVRFQEHVLAVSEIAVELHEAHEVGRLELVRFEAEPASWRQYQGLGGEQQVIRPDAFAAVAIGDYEYLSFIEVDLGTEGLSTIRSKAEAYERYAASGVEQQRSGVFPRVVFLTTNQHRLSALQRTLHVQAHGSDLFAVALLDQAITALSGGSA